MNKVFKNVGESRPPRSLFNLSYEKKFTCDMGELIPVLADEAIPGDVWKIGNSMVMRFTPLVAPILHQVDVYVHYFFVPYRLCDVPGVTEGGPWKWEDFITGGKDGDDSQNPPVWSLGGTSKGGISDYLGWPVGVAVPGNNSPLRFPVDAYHLIWNEYYRDETLQDLVVLGSASETDNLLLRNWEKDYFTSALLSQQRGTAPALPITGTSSAVWDSSSFIDSTAGGYVRFDDTNDVLHVGTGGEHAHAEAMFNDNVVDLSSAGTFDVSDLRLAFQIQKFMERNERAGVRYTSFLSAHFGVSPRDDRLQRPEYIGGCKCPVIISEVLQTSKTDGTAYQGTMTGHGISINQEFICKYHVQEFGVVMGILSVMPKPAYQQGINRQWLRKTRYDFYFPEFAHLSEQAIIREEIYANNVENDNETIFGYAGAYDEMRTKMNMVCGNFRDTYDYWHMGRQFGSAPELNESFIQCVPRKDCFAVSAEDCCLISFANIITALRPMPIIAEPGLIDHG